MGTIQLLVPKEYQSSDNSARMNFYEYRKNENAEAIGDDTCKLAEGIGANLFLKSNMVEEVNNVVRYGRVWKGVKRSSAPWWRGIHTFFAVSNHGFPRFQFTKHSIESCWDLRGLRCPRNRRRIITRNVISVAFGRDVLNICFTHWQARSQRTKEVRLFSNARF